MAMTLQNTYNSVPAIGVAGLLEGDSDHEVWTLKNAEASASMRFGTAVAFKSGGTTDLDAAILSGATDKVAGIIAHSNAYARAWTDGSGTTFGDLDSTGLRPGATLNVLRQGKILVPCVTGCAPGDKLHVAYNASGATYTVAGTMGNALEAGHTIDFSTVGTWLTTAAANGLAWLDVDFANKQGAGE